MVKLKTYVPFCSSPIRTLAEDGEELDYKAHYILMATMSTTTAESVEALDLPEIQEAVVSAVALLQGPSMDKDSVLVSVFTFSAIPLLYSCLILGCS